MTSLLPSSRALSFQLVSRVSHLKARQRACAKSWSRVSNNLGCLSSLLQYDASTPTLGHLLLRYYATKPGRPKAHTGRAAASTRKPAVARSDAAAGVPKKAPAKKAPAKKAVTRKKPAAKRGAAKKPARKASSKTKPKPKPKRKGLTDKQKATKEKKVASDRIKDFKKRALLDRPKKLPFTTFTVYQRQSLDKGTSATAQSKDIAAQYKRLSPEETERLNHVANENRAKNDAALKKWLDGYTPAEIKAANSARNYLNKIAKKKGQKKMFIHFHDERVVKRPRSPYVYFLQDRFASGDMKNMKILETTPLIAREWKALTAAQKKPYEDKAAQDLARYADEYMTVYGEAPKRTKAARNTK